MSRRGAKCCYGGLLLAFAEATSGILCDVHAGELHVRLVSLNLVRQHEKVDAHSR